MNRFVNSPRCLWAALLFVTVLFSYLYLDLRLQVIRYQKVNIQNFFTINKDLRTLDHALAGSKLLPVQ